MKNINSKIPCILGSERAAELGCSDIKMMEAEIEPEPGCMEYVIKVGQAEYYDLGDFRLIARGEFSVRWNHEFEILLTVEE